MTDTELMLWKHLRAKRLGGFKFRRQEEIGKYIVDFICYERMIVVECDGGQHLESVRDLLRDTWFKEQGYKVLRFWNDEILKNLDSVLGVILDECRGHPPPDPLPSREGGRD